MIIFTAPPPAFVQAVEQRLKQTHMHVIDWWADDLDGDNVPESIALTCDTYGEYIVQHGKQVLELTSGQDGRNNCPDAGATPPPWHVEHAGVIAFGQSVHHGSVSAAFAIRDGKLVQLREHSEGFSEDRNGDNTDEVEDVDYDKLRWSSSVKPPKHKATVTSGPLVIVTDHVKRTNTIIGATTLAATRNDTDGTYVLHVHADRALTIKADKTARLAPGDSELAIEQTGEIQIIAGGTTIHVRFFPLDDDARYPAAPSPASTRPGTSP